MPAPEEDDPRIRALLREAERQSEAAFPNYRRGRRTLLIAGLPVWLILLPAMGLAGAPVSGIVVVGLLPVSLAALVTFRWKAR